MSQCLGTGEELEASREGLPGSTQSPACSGPVSRWSGCFPLLSSDVGVEKRASARPPPAWPLRQGDRTSGSGGLSWLSWNRVKGLAGGDQCSRAGELCVLRHYEIGARRGMVPNTLVPELKRQ